MKTVVRRGGVGSGRGCKAYINFEEHRQRGGATRGCGCKHAQVGREGDGDGGAGVVEPHGWWKSDAPRWTLVAGEGTEGKGGEGRGCGG